MTDLGLSDGGNYLVGGAQCHTAFGLTSLTTEFLATCGIKKHINPTMTDNLALHHLFRCLSISCSTICKWSAQLPSPCLANLYTQDSIPLDNN